MMAIILSLSSLPRSSQVLIEASARFRVPFAPSSSREGQISWLLATSTWATGWSGKLDLTWVFILMWVQTCRKVARIAVGDQVIGAQGSGPGQRGYCLPSPRLAKHEHFTTFGLLYSHSLYPSPPTIYTHLFLFFFSEMMRIIVKKPCPKFASMAPPALHPSSIHVAFYP